MAKNFFKDPLNLIFIGGVLLLGILFVYTLITGESPLERWNVSPTAATIVTAVLMVVLLFGRGLIRLIFKK